MKPIIGISVGDYNGIGPEVALISAASPVVRKVCTPVLIGPQSVFAFYAKRVRHRFPLKEIASLQGSLSSQSLSIFSTNGASVGSIRPGTLSQSAGRVAANAIEVATQLCVAGTIDAMVTSPTSKEAMHKAGIRFPGQTEMVAHLSKASAVMMMLVAGQLRVALATVHIPLDRVARNLSSAVIAQKLQLLGNSLRVDFGIRSPRIAVLGLNPHAGEGGLIGTEELKIITPAIRSVQRNLTVDGPFPADGFFGSHSYKKYDAILAMYHDQGLIPLKLMGFDVGVNFSAGLPIVRTSPDHGTAFDIAGKGIARPSSMIEAIILATKIVQNRKRFSSK